MPPDTDLSLAEAEIAAEFGAFYRDYAHDLVLLRRLASRGFTPRVIYDVGGSDGIWSAMALRVFPACRFEIFEPLYEISAEYRSPSGGERWPQLAGNQVRFHSIALGHQTGEVLMTVYPGSVGSTSIPLDYPVAEASTLEVPQWRLDDYIALQDLPLPDLIKLDTQGGELQILQGAPNTLCTVSAVLCECWLFHGYGSSTPLWLEVANELAHYDLSLFDSGWSYRRPSDQRVATDDMLFLRRSLPFSPLFHFAARSDEPAEETRATGSEKILRKILDPLLALAKR